MYNNYDYSKANWDGLCDCLLDSDLCLCKEESDVEDIWFIFIKHTVSTAMALFIPKVRLIKKVSIPLLVHV